MQKQENQDKLETFVKLHNYELIHILTPDGYVTIDTKSSELIAHLGFKDSERKINWDDLKSQSICNAIFDNNKNTWHIITDYSA